MITAQDIIKLIEKDITNTDIDIEPETPLFSEGLLDSMQLTSLFLSLEQAYQVSIGVFDVSLENFDTPEQIAAWVNNKLNEK